MSLDSVAYTIINESISNIICIDDRFCEPYEHNEALSGDELAGAKLYASLSKKNKSVEVLKYSRGEVETAKEKMAKNDLVIIDWELQTTAVEYEDTLELICAACKNNTKYVAIYSGKDFSAIKVFLIGYFNKYSISRLSELYRQAYEEFLDDYSESHLFNEVKSIYSKDVSNEDIKKLLEDNGAFGTFIELSKKVSKETNQKINLIDLVKIFGIMAACSLFNKDEEVGEIKVLNHEKNVFILNNTFITLIRKKEGETSEVDHNTLVDELAEVIWDTPYNLLTVAWLEANTKFAKIQKILCRDTKI